MLLVIQFNSHRKDGKRSQKVGNLSPTPHGKTCIWPPLFRHGPRLHIYKLGKAHKFPNKQGKHGPCAKEGFPGCLHTFLESANTSQPLQHPQYTEKKPSFPRPCAVTASPAMVHKGQLHLHQPGVWHWKALKMFAQHSTGYMNERTNKCKAVAFSPIRNAN